MQPDNHHILIDKETLVTDIQDAFNNLYPYLRIEFFRGEKLSAKAKNRNVNLISRIKDIAYIHTPVTLDIESKRTVAEIARDCMNLLGLSTQVFRKSGNIWNEITLTDNWTLESQNKAGQSISAEIADP